MGLRTVTHLLLPLGPHTADASPPPDPNLVHLSFLLPDGTLSAGRPALQPLAHLEAYRLMSTPEMLPPAYATSICVCRKLLPALR